MLHESETWPVRKKNLVTLQRAEMRMVRWMCGVKLKDRLPSKELRERLGIDDIALVLQQNRLRWYGHVLRKDDDDWVKKCIEYEVEGLRPRGRPKRTWREVVQEDCQARKMNKMDAIDRCKWRKMIKDVRWSGWVWVGECFFWYRPTQVAPDQRPLNGCVCVCSLDYFGFVLSELVSLGLAFFNTKPRDWLGRTSPKWPISCRVGRKTLLSQTGKHVMRAKIKYTKL